VQFVVRVQAGSTEYASLIALTTGTATFTMTRDATTPSRCNPEDGLQRRGTWQYGRHRTLQITGVQLYDATNGLVTVTVTTPQNGICQ